MDRHTYVPPKKTGPAIALAGGCFALSAALLVSFGLRGSPGGVLWTAAFPALLGITLTARYILPSFVYVLERGLLTVSRVQGGSSVRVAAVALSEAEGLFGREELREYEKKMGRIRTKRGYCRNLFVKNPYTLAVSGEGGTWALVIEADEYFAGLIREYLDVLRPSQ